MMVLSDISGNIEFMGYWWVNILCEFSNKTILKYGITEYYWITEYYELLNILFIILIIHY